jgi:hypothetical protein
MAIDISTFKAGFNGGTRANRFNVDIDWPADIDDAPTELSYHAVAAKLPENELGSIPVPWMGRVAHFAGDRDYKPWTVTFIDDISGTNNKHLWHAFHSWMNLINSHVTNTTGDQKFSRGNLLKTVTFNQLHDPSGGSTTTGHTVIRKINLQHAWPSEISQISFDMGEGGSLINFSVTFTFDYYTIDTNN